MDESPIIGRIVGEPRRWITLAAVVAGGSAIGFLCGSFAIDGVMMPRPDLSPSVASYTPPMASRDDAAMPLEIAPSQFPVMQAADYGPHYDDDLYREPECRRPSSDPMDPCYVYAEEPPVAAQPAIVAEAPAPDESELSTPIDLLPAGLTAATAQGAAPAKPALPPIVTISAPVLAGSGAP